MDEKFSVEKRFLFIALIFGVLYIFILPPFQSVDESSHFYRNYEISSGNFFAHTQNGFAGDILPLSLENLSSKYNFLIKNIDKKITPNYILSSSKINLEPEKTGFVKFINSAIYSPVCYI